MSRETALAVRQSSVVVSRSCICPECCDSSTTWSQILWWQMRHYVNAGVKIRSACQKSKSSDLVRAVRACIDTSRQSLNQNVVLIVLRTITTR